jgi:transcriptional regulator with XRE-family HTH domain
MSDRNWSEYKLAIEAKLSHSTLANIFKRNASPSIPTLNSICVAFGITLAQFFQEGNLVDLSDEQLLMFTRWLTLSPEQKQILCDLIENMKQIRK